MKKLHILMFVILGIASSCMDTDPNPAKRYIDLYVGDEKVKAEMVDSSVNTETPPPSGDCLKGSPPGMCCIFTGVSYRCY